MPRLMTESMLVLLALACLTLAAAAAVPCRIIDLRFGQDGAARAASVGVPTNYAGHEAQAL